MPKNHNLTPPGFNSWARAKYTKVTGRKSLQGVKLKDIYFAITGKKTSRKYARPKLISLMKSDMESRSATKYDAGMHEYIDKIKLLGFCAEVDYVFSGCAESKPKRRQVDICKTPKWRKLRYEAFAKYGNKCQCCGASPETGAVLHVDHIKPKSIYPELAFNIDNLQILCEDCNMGKSNLWETDWR